MPPSLIRKQFPNQRLILQGDREYDNLTQHWLIRVTNFKHSRLGRFPCFNKNGRGSGLSFLRLTVRGYSLVYRS